MEKIQVLVKIRPRTEEEVKLNLKDHSSIQTSIQSFNFEHTFGPTCTNSDVYEVIAPMVERCKIGYNATVLSYGQKSSGKSHTMIGNDNDPGVAILASRQLFQEKAQPPFQRQFIIRVGFIEIYNETLYDLLNYRQVVQFGGQIDSDKLSNKEVVVNDRETIAKLLERGNRVKLLKSKADAPSCSHTIFQIIIENQEQTLENAPAEIGCLNLVDLDRSEGAEVKNEKGKCFDKSLMYLKLAIRAMSKGETFRNHSKSKLTRLLQLGENSDTAIICHVTPTSPSQTNLTLNFANEARNVATKAICNKFYSDDVMIKRVRADINRLQRLKNDLEPLLLNSSKIDNEIADLNSILLSEKDMRPQGHTKFVETNKVLKIRSFFPGLVGMQKKYQIGEMKDMSVDAQSRSQRKSRASEWSDFFLERVGFELNLNMRRHLKYGKNVIGRSTVDSDVDICVDSLECSRKHCYIDVSADLSVVIKDLNSSNGTAVNGVRYKNRTIDLHEGDVISIVGANQSLVGNFDCTVYRLCRFTTEKMKFFDLDEDLIAISDDDGDNDTPYHPIKIEPSSLKASEVVDQTSMAPTLEPSLPKIFSDTSPTTPKLMTCAPVTSTPSSTSIIQKETETIIVIDDDNGSDTSYFPVKMELELPEPSKFVEIGTEQLTTAAESTPSSTTTSGSPMSTETSWSTTPGSTTSQLTTPPSTSAQLSQNDDDKLNLDSSILDDAAFDDLKDIITMPIIQDENVSQIQNENAQLLQQLQDYEFEKKLQAEQIMQLQAKLLAREEEKNALLHENAITAAKLREVEKDRDVLREKCLKHVGEILEHLYEGKKAKFD